MRHLLPLASASLLAACVAPSSPPPAAPPPPTVAPAPAPAPAPTPVPLSSDWRDWPITPGDWTYRAASSGGSASFGEAGAAPRLTVRCDRQAGRVTLERVGATGNSITIRTTSLTRALPTQPTASGAGASLTPRDPLLDAMAFSRGRFILEMPGTAHLAVPNWAELARVVEDCR